MSKLAQSFKDRIVGGLRRQALTSPGQWACDYRVMGKPYPGPFSFLHHPWLRFMHDSTSDLNVGQKSAQMGYTETLLNWTFFGIDIQQESRLYVLPTDDDAIDFTASRFDPALESSPYLSALFTDVKNTRHKRAGSASLFIRGSRSRNKLKSVPVGGVAFDELDEMVQDNIVLAMERMSGQLRRQAWMVSTPTVNKYGINRWYQDSTQEHFFFPCPHCSVHVELTFPDCVIIDEANPEKSQYKCSACGHILDWRTRVEWLQKMKPVVANSAANYRGFYINQMYSMHLPPEMLVRAYLKSQSDPASEQEFYNSKLGLPHIVEGAQLTDEELEACIGNYGRGDLKPGTYITMGIDVGKWLHYEIDEWSFTADVYGDINTQATPRIIDMGKVLDFEQLDKIMNRYRPMSAIIDANPERRKAIEFCNRHYGIAHACFYGRDVRSRDIVYGRDLPTITVDRTSWLDMSQYRFKNKTILIPKDTPLEYKDHVKSLVKKFEKDTDGNVVPRYFAINDDHYAHTRNYNEIALAVGKTFATSQNIKGVI